LDPPARALDDKTPGLHNKLSVTFLIESGKIKNQSEAARTTPGNKNAATFYVAASEF
jgi:hypothetical protein